MEHQKITLSQLESFLMGICDELRGKMDASQYKEYVFGLLFLKRLSDIFEQKQEKIRIKFKHLPDHIDELLEKKDSYGDTFFVPPRARWNTGFTDENGNEQPPIKHLHTNIGSMLNKALFAIEDENPSLNGIFKDRINFNREVDGKKIVSDTSLEKIIEKFENFGPLLNENFEFPDLLGAAYEYLLKYFADEGGKKGGQFYTPNLVVRLLVQLLKVEEGMSVYDPTAGSGGMLIQSYQYIEEQGKDASKLEIVAQENEPDVVAICRMNIILHNISNYQVYFGDTIDNPLNIENGQIKQFDRVIANPPFSQNYTFSSDVENHHKERFSYGMLPETGKKADLMFVQHMLASCKNTGRVVVVMPHGVLFRGQKEKDVRQNLIESKYIEGIIGLPPQLFYGTGIPACIMVFNKNKNEDLKEKIFFINADKDFKEGKNQNSLRPEDIEKIDYVFTNKFDVEKYSRLVDLDEIRANNYTLNIRRYVDNTDEPEPHDVKAHLIGGVPKTEIEVIDSIQGAKFNFTSTKIFKNKNSNYKDFAVNQKSEIKQIVESDKNVQQVTENLIGELGNWWTDAKELFSTLANKKNDLPTVRSGLLNSIKEKFEPLKVLDKYQIAGAFVNWWDNIKFDLKTIIQRGWEIDLIYPDYSEYLVKKYFAEEQAEIDNIKIRQTENESELAELVENALSICEYEPEENDEEDSKEIKLTPKLAKEELASQIADFKEKQDEANVKQLEEILKKIKDAEETNKSLKIELSEKQEDLETKLLIKCYGAADEIEKYEVIQNQIRKEYAEHEKQKPADEKGKVFTAWNKKYKKFQKDFDALQIKIEEMINLEKEISVITKSETKELILQKHFDLISSQLMRYVQAEKRTLIASFENLFEKYSVSAEQIKNERENILADLTENLKQLNYFG